MIIDHYHIGASENSCSQCKPDRKYVEDLPCAVVDAAGGHVTVVPIVRVDSGKPFVQLEACAKCGCERIPPAVTNVGGKISGADVAQSTTEPEAASSAADDAARPTVEAALNVVPESCCFRRRPCAHGFEIERGTVRLVGAPK